MEILQDYFWLTYWCAWFLPHIFPLHQSRAIPAHFGWWWSCLRFFPVFRYPFNSLFNFLPLTDISLLDHAKTESITNYNTNSKLSAGVSLKGAKAKRLIQTNSKQGAVVLSKDEKTLRVWCWVCSFATTKYTKKTRTKKNFGIAPLFASRKCSALK